MNAGENAIHATFGDVVVVAEPQEDGLVEVALPNGVLRPVSVGMLSQPVVDPDALPS